MNKFLIIAVFWFVAMVIVNYTVPVLMLPMIIGLFIIAICAFFMNTKDYEVDLTK